MAPLPHAEQALLDLRKIENYCLDPAHPRGRHKVRVFREALGIDRSDAQWLRQVLLAAARKTDAIELGFDLLGSRWRLDFEYRTTRQGRRGKNGLDHTNRTFPAS